MPCLNVLMPSLNHFRFTGGPNTIFGLTYRLAARGVPVRYVSMDGDPSGDTGYLWRHMKALTGIDNADASVGPADPDGVYMATTWQTAYHASEKADRFIYFIQDYEPLLCRPTHDADMARKAYYLDFYAIVNERVLADHLGFIGPGYETFEPAVDAEMFYPEEKKRLLVFYARPNRQRNLFAVGVEALRHVAKAGLLDGWTVRSVGSRQPPIELAPGVLMKNVVWNRLENYAAMMRKTSVALCLQLSPHTGYPVMEVSACGGVGVTTAFQTKTRERIQEYAPRSVVVGPTVDAVADGLKRAIGGERSFEPLRGLAAKSWDEAFAPVLPRVEEMFHEISRKPMARGGRV